MKTSSIFILSLSVASMDNVAGFVGRQSPSSSVSVDTQLQATDPDISNVGMESSSRRGFLGVAGVAAASFLTAPMAAFADEEADEPTSEGGGGIGSIMQSTNVRNLKRAEKQLNRLELYAVDNEYEDLKSALRNAPFSEVRKNSFAIIKDYADQPELQTKLDASYKLFVKAVEKLDSTASLGMRGRKLGEGELLQCFQATTAALNDWITVASTIGQESS